MIDGISQLKVKTFQRLTSQNCIELSGIVAKKKHFRMCAMKHCMMNDSIYPMTKEEFTNGKLIYLS